MLGSKCKGENVSFYRSLTNKEKKQYNRDPSGFMNRYLEEENLTDEGTKILGLRKKVKRLQNKLAKRDVEIERLKSKLNSRKG